jgi:predicted kinase
MTSLGIDLFDEEARARVEELQQAGAEDLLALGITVIYESGGWTRQERDALRQRA